MPNSRGTVRRNERIGHSKLVSSRELTRNNHFFRALNFSTSATNSNNSPMIAPIISLSTFQLMQLSLLFNLAKFEISRIRRGIKHPFFWSHSSQSCICFLTIQRIFTKDLRKYKKRLNAQGNHTPSFPTFALFAAIRVVLRTLYLPTAIFRELMQIGALSPRWARECDLARETAVKLAEI